MSSVSRIFPGLVSRGRQKAHSLLAERRERSSQRCYSLYILKILISSFKIERGMTRMNDEEENGEWKYNACENRLNSE